MAKGTGETVTDFRVRQLADGRVVSVIPLTFGRARVCVGSADGLCYDDGW